MKVLFDITGRRLISGIGQTVVIASEEWPKLEIGHIKDISESQIVVITTNNEVLEVNVSQAHLQLAIID